MFKDHVTQSDLSGFLLRTERNMHTYFYSHNLNVKPTSLTNICFLISNVQNIGI